MFLNNRLVTSAQARLLPGSGIDPADWAPADHPLHKLALTPSELPALTAAVRALAGRVHVSAGGNVAFVSLPIGANPAALKLPAMTLRGAGPLWHNAPPTPAIAAAVKTALDPQNRFPSITD